MYKIKNKHVFVKKKEKKKLLKSHKLKFLTHPFFQRSKKKKPTYQLYQARVIVKTSHNHLL